MPSFFKSLFGQVVLALILGVVLGALVPDFAVALKPLGDGFIKLIKMVIAPLVFCVVVLGISGTGDLKKVGRVGVKAVIYFEILTTFALVIGIVLAYVFQPGVGMNIDPASLDASAMAAYTDRVGEVQGGTVDFIMKIIPATMIDAFAKGDILQVLLDRDPGRCCRCRAGRARPAGVRRDRVRLARPVRGHVLHRQAGAAGCPGCDRLHRRQVRRRLLGPARLPGADLLRLLRPVRPPGAGLGDAFRGLQHRQVPQVHPRGAPDRPGHCVLRRRAAAAHAQAQGARRRRIRPWAW